MIDEVYPCFTEQQQREYNLTYSGLKIGIEHRLQPLHYDEKSEEDFYQQFDGMKVLPISLIDDYRAYLERKQFIRAEGLFVSVRESRFCFLFRNGDIYKQRICHAGTNDTIEDRHIMVINKKYDAERGLQMESKASTDNFL